MNGLIVHLLGACFCIENRQVLQFTTYNMSVQCVLAT